MRSSTALHGSEVEILLPYELDRHVFNLQQIVSGQFAVKDCTARLFVPNNQLNAAYLKQHQQSRMLRSTAANKHPELHRFSTRPGLLLHSCYTHK
jgi:hypothetical protein